jgi:hypothetical protein
MISAKMEGRHVDVAAAGCTYLELAHHAADPHAIAAV